MNFGIINNSRPDPRQRGRTSSVNALLADPRMRAIAKQMGLQPKDFGDEAKALWSTLNDLSTSDPKRYASFINEQLQDGPPPPSDSPVNNAEKDPALPRFFSPDPGFVVKCMMYHTIKYQQKLTKLFLNICGHKLIDAPKNPNSGREVPMDTRAVPNTNSLQVPLVVGKLREFMDVSSALCCVVDVVVNPWVFRRCEWDVNFKWEVMKLAIQYVQEDALVRLVTPMGKFIKARYKGGVIVGSEILTSKFRIEDVEKTEQRIDSPADLLKQIDRSAATKDEGMHQLVIKPSKETKATQKPNIVLPAAMVDVASIPPKPAMKPGTSSVKKKVLIEEIPSPLIYHPAAHDISTATKSANIQRRPTKKNAVKRGFLNSTTSTLYPKGSSEGRPPSAYVNLLSRSKVVDLNELDQQRTAERDELATQKRSAMVSGSDELDHGDHIFEQLCDQAESDFKPMSQQNGGRSDTVNGDHLFNGGFEELAKLLAP